MITRITRITSRKPDDWHCHMRDGEMLKAVRPATAAHIADLFERRHVAGAAPNAFLKARENAASNS